MRDGAGDPVPREQEGWATSTTIEPCPGRVEDRAGSVRIRRDGEEVGWVDGQAVGFLGFRDEAEALRAASIAHEALSAWAARQSRLESVPRIEEALRVRRRDGVASIVLGDVAIGRIVYVPAAPDVGGMDVGFELRLPPRLDGSAALGAAAVADAALRRHLWHADLLRPRRCAP